MQLATSVGNVREINQSVCACVCVGDAHKSWRVWQFRFITQLAQRCSKIRSFNCAFVNPADPFRASTSAHAALCLSWPEKHAAAELWYMAVIVIDQRIVINICSSLLPVPRDFCLCAWSRNEQGVCEFLPGSETTDAFHFPDCDGDICWVSSQMRV